MHNYQVGKHKFADIDYYEKRFDGKNDHFFID